MRADRWNSEGSQEAGTDVIVMGWRGHGAVRRLLMGSVSRGVVRRVSCSMPVVRRLLRELRHIIVVYDGSPHAERALAFLAALTPKRGTRATVFRAVDTMHVPAQGLITADTRATVAAEVARINDERRTQARKGLARAAKTLSAAGWRVDEVVTEGAPLRELLATVHKTRANLVVLGAKGVTGLRHFLLGSVAEAALNRCPFLCSWFGDARPCSTSSQLTRSPRDEPGCRRFGRGDEETT